MIKLMLLLGACMILAYCSQNGILVVPLTQKRKLDIPYVLIIIVLSLFVGLRTNYNDTYLYIKTFQSAPSVSVYLENSFDLFDNPLFNLFQSFFRHHISDNFHLYFVIIALYTTWGFVRCMRKHSENFVFSIFLFFAIGMLTFSLAAMKQCLAMATLMFAIDFLIKGKPFRYILLVLFASLFHTFALVFIVLPLFVNKPWTITTFLAILGVVTILFTFRTSISAFMNISDSSGDLIDSDAVFNTVGINPFRLAVYSVPSILLILFQGVLNDEYTRTTSLFANMSIISFLIMSLGLISGANMFGRAAIYFNFGMITILPWIIKRIFDEKSFNVACMMTGVCYFAFFIYSILGFSAEYRSIGIGEFIYSLL